jgi:hypothetical protein
MIPDTCSRYVYLPRLTPCLRGDEKPSTAALAKRTKRMQVGRMSGAEELDAELGVGHGMIIWIIYG